MRPGRQMFDHDVPDRIDTTGLPATIAAEIDALAGRAERWTEPGAGVGPGVRARALVLAGDTRTARAVLEGLDPGRAEPPELVAAAWALSRVGPVALVAPVLARFADVPADAFLGDDDLPLGPVALVRGWGAMAAGDLDAAEADLTAAAEVGDRRAPFWGALARMELARVLRSRALLDDDPEVQQRSAERATRAETSARTFLVAGGYRGLLARIEAESDDGADRVDDERSGPWASPHVGWLRPGEAWTIGVGVAPPALVPDRRGLVALRHLVAHRHRRVPAVELDRLLDGAAVSMFARAALDGTLDALVDRPDGAGGDVAGAAALRALLADDRA
ncbi:MAG TPA: hypothetical protein VK866_02750, partial [Acidimicrobiales bacterium]|nr:hypothetical protein [Acidimicrobiales bacterium]